MKRSLRRAWLVCLIVLVVDVPVLAIVGPGSAGGATADQPARLVSDPAGLVDPMDGTGTGPVSPGAVGEFPGADLPFGMIQWSPDTVPNAAASGGGYSYADSHINGFSLTHLSGTGCAVYQDVPILPTVGPVGKDPVATTESFSHSTEHAAPGRYSVRLGSHGVSAALSVTMRTGISQFVFPATTQANVLLKVADSANPVSGSEVRIAADGEVSGQVTSGQFCQTGTNYTVYFDARFSRPFSSAGTWDGKSVRPGTGQCSGSACGAFLTFDTEQDRDVLMKVGISFVSQANAAENLRNEDPGWSLAGVEANAQHQWNEILNRIAIGGGSKTDRRIFYTALYHSLLYPNVVSDDNGQYPGADGRVHVATGQAEYSNFSEWDIYRSEIELESMVAPRRVGDMVQSLIDEADQGGWLPKWAIVGGDASQMNGDSADPIIADAYAFGVRNFNVEAALAAMVKGATESESGHGLEIERQYLSQYLAQHYVDASSLDITSINYSIGGSVTLEYALDDFAISQLAEQLGDNALAAQMTQRAHNWEYLFNPATGYVQAKGADGSFPPGHAFQKSMLEPGGQLGFEEGNAVQYTWAVPQDLSALADLIGGDNRATAELTTFFTKLNAGRDQPFDWAGNEPSLWSPWEFDAFGAPWKSQAVVREIADDLYADAPVDEPGNDDLGAIASWYVWAAIGLYPLTPGTANLAVASPLFPVVSVDLSSGHHLVEHAPNASRSTPFVHSLRVVGNAVVGSAATCSPGAQAATSKGDWNQPWLPSSVLANGATLTFDLGSTPDRSWASDPGNAFPSAGAGRIPALGYTRPSGGTKLAVGQPGTVDLGVQPAQAGSETVDWRASGAGLVVTPASGSFVIGTSTGSTSSTAGSGTSCAANAPSTQALTVTAQSPGSRVLEVQLQTTKDVALPPVDVDLDVTG